MDTGRAAGPLRSAVAVRCRGAVDSGWFGVAAFWLIIGNAVLLGVETYPAAVAEWHTLLKAVEHGFLGVFTLEAVVRAGACADRPARYFRDPWNVFDLAVVVLAYLPFATENATALRLLRLARVLRAARMMPQLRIIIVAIGRSLPGAVGFVLAGTLLLYVYAMLGWLIFAESDPERYGTLGRAALTLFLLITLDGLGDAVRHGMTLSPWSVLYFGSFVLVNVLIGVVLNSLDEARRLEQAADRPTDAEKRLSAGIAEIRQILDSLEPTTRPDLPSARSSPAKGG